MQYNSIKFIFLITGAVYVDLDWLTDFIIFLYFFVYVLY